MSHHVGHQIAAGSSSGGAESTNRVVRLVEPEMLTLGGHRETEPVAFRLPPVQPSEKGGFQLIPQIPVTELFNTETDDMGAGTIFPPPLT
jgi:hypothetical protein